MNIGLISAAPPQRQPGVVPIEDQVFPLQQLFAEQRLQRALQTALPGLMPGSVEMDILGFT